MPPSPVRAAIAWRSPKRSLDFALGLTRPDLAPLFERLIYPVLGMLLYATFLHVPFRELRRAVGHGRYLIAVLTMNFLVVPVVVWLLARLAPQDPAVLLGVYLVLLTPCIECDRLRRYRRR